MGEENLKMVGSEGQSRSCGCLGARNLSLFPAREPRIVVCKKKEESEFCLSVFS
jgi:hypothetical protein